MVLKPFLGNCHLQEYLLLEVTFLWTTTKITKTGRVWVNAGSSHRLKQLKYFISFFKVLWMEGIHLECAAALKASEDLGSCSAPGKLQSSLCFGIRIHQAAGWCSAGQLESFVERATRGTTCTLPFLFFFFCTVWILVKLPVYRHFSSELEKLKILEYVHWNIAESLSVEWRTQQTWRTMKISSKEVTSPHTAWGPSTSSLL